MLTSFNTSTHEEEDEQETHANQRTRLDVVCRNRNIDSRHAAAAAAAFVISQSDRNTQVDVNVDVDEDTSLRLLLNCANLIHQSDFTAARRLLSVVSTNTSAQPPELSGADRVAQQFASALSIRLNHLSLSFSLQPPPSQPNPDDLQSCYLSLNKITPFLRFCHLTANQAILEAVDRRQPLHILDFDTMHGVQWPPLMHAIAERADPNQPPSLRITGTGTDLDILHRTGERLKTFADTLGLRFQFHPLLLIPPNRIGTGSSTLSASCTQNISPSTFQLHPGETLAVNCVLFLHTLLKDNGDDDEVRSFLQAIKTMNPAVVTIAEREASHNSSRFLQRFMEALEHYAAIFDTLEATLPPNNYERLLLENIWFGREIADIVAGEGRYRQERHERFDRWEHLMKTSDFTSVPSSPFALSQAKLLLRLHYPSEGYQLQMIKDSLFLGWKTNPLFSVSSWH